MTRSTTRPTRTEPLLQWQLIAPAIRRQLQAPKRSSKPDERNRDFRSTPLAPRAHPLTSRQRLRSCPKPDNCASDCPIWGSHQVSHLRQLSFRLIHLDQSPRVPVGTAELALGPVQRPSETGAERFSPAKSIARSAAERLPKRLCRVSGCTRGARGVERKSRFRSSAA